MLRERGWLGSGVCCSVVWCGGVGTGALVVKCIGRVWEDFSYVKLTLRPKISYVCPVAPYRGEEGNHRNAQIIISVICFHNCQLLTLHRSLTAAQAEQEDEDNGKHGIWMARTLSLLLPACSASLLCLTALPVCSVCPRFHSFKGSSLPERKRMGERAWYAARARSSASEARVESASIRRFCCLYNGFTCIDCASEWNNEREREQPRVTGQTSRPHSSRFTVALQKLFLVI